MNNNIRFFLMAFALVPALAGASQNTGEEKFAVKATADIGLGSALSVKSALPEMSKKSSSFDIGVDFGYTFWRQQQHSLEANIGLGYGSYSLTSEIGSLKYSYDAPAGADDDGVPYIRYYDLSNLRQKVSAGRLTIPIYVNYGYRLNKVVNLHALLGFKFGFNFSPKIKEASGDSFSYGVYPIYDDLMIDASYMNNFGETKLSKEETLAPKANGFGASIMAGIGAEFSIYGPLSADLTFRYEGGLTNVFKAAHSKMETFNASNVPVSYTVSEGQTFNSFTDYLSKSKFSRLSLAIGLIYRF